MSKPTYAGRSQAGVQEPLVDPDEPYQTYPSNTADADPTTGNVMFVGVSANDMLAPIGVKTGQPLASTTPLGTTTLTTDFARTASYGRAVGTIFSNSAGTLLTQWSNDGTNWDTQNSDAVSAATTSGAGLSFSHEVVALYVRWVFTPSASNSVLRFYPLLRRMGTA